MGMEGFGDALSKVFYTLFVFAVIAILAVGYIITNWICTPKHKTIESKTLIKPEIRLKTDGTKIDTFYLYKK